MPLFYCPKCRKRRDLKSVTTTAAMGNQKVMTEPRCLAKGCGELVIPVKPLKFKDSLVNSILDGVKTITWRIKDDKNLTKGDKLLFANADWGGDFALAEIVDVGEKKLGGVSESDFEEGHERYKSKDDMLLRYRDYYGQDVNWDSLLKIVKFKILETVAIDPPTSYAYGKGYIYLPLTQSFAGFPDELPLDGKILHKKEAFHVSLVCVKEIAPLLAASKKISQIVAEYRLGLQFNEYAQKHPITFRRFRDEFRHATEEDNESVVLLCDLENLEGFFKELNGAWRVDIPVQPAHTTVYCLIPGKGIGITSQAAMDQCPKIALPELSRGLEKMRFK